MNDISTICSQAGIDSDEHHGAVIPPLYLSTNYSFKGLNDSRQYDYCRSGNPTRDLLGETLAQLEGGYGGVMVASGMAAVDLPFKLLNPGDTVIVPHDSYGGTHRLTTAYAKKKIYDIHFVDQTDKDALRVAFDKKPKMILVETPSNPLLRITDIEFIVSLAKENNTLVVADNTFLSPVLQNPISLGVDVVVHSTTKYINGHSDSVGGGVVAKSKELYEELHWWANCTGTTSNPFDNYLTLRGLRTLNIRVQQQQASAEKIVAFLSKHNAVSKVYYPGLEEHEGHDIALKQQKGFGAMLSFELNGNEQSVRDFIQKLKHFTLAESLGGFESLICHPSTMTHAAVSSEDQKIAGIRPNLLRLSIGLENTDDLIASLDTALKA